MYVFVQKQEKYYADTSSYLEQYEFFFLYSE